MFLISIFNGHNGHNGHEFENIIFYYVHYEKYNGRITDGLKTEIFLIIADHDGFFHIMDVISEIITVCLNAFFITY